MIPLSLVTFPLTGSFAVPEEDEELSESEELLLPPPEELSLRCLISGVVNFSSVAGLT